MFFNMYGGDDDEEEGMSGLMKGLIIVGIVVVIGSIIAVFTMGGDSNVEATKPATEVQDTSATNDSTKSTAPGATSTQAPTQAPTKPPAPTAGPTLEYISKPNEATKNYADIKAVCESQGLRLCNSVELCQGRTPNEKVNVFGDADNWIAVSNRDNEWFTYNKAGDRLCKTHSAVAGDVPAWGVKADAGGWFRAGKCCNPLAKTGTISGRFIKLVQPYQVCLNLSQIQVYSTADGPNIITPSTAITKSSNFGEDVFPVNNFRNNNLRNFMHTSCTDTPWVLVDLGSEVPINKIILFNRVDCCLGRANGIILSIHDNNMNAVYIAEPLSDKKGSTKPNEDNVNYTDYFGTFTFLPPDPKPKGALQQGAAGDNGTVSCETYCAGTGGQPWNGELPKVWNGAKCVATNTKGIDCNSKWDGAKQAVQCVCEATGTGWK